MIFHIGMTQTHGLCVIVSIPKDGRNDIVICQRIQGSMSVVMSSLPLSADGDAECYEVLKKVRNAIERGILCI